MERPSHWLDAGDCGGDQWEALTFNVTEDFEDELINLKWAIQGRS